MNEGVSDKWRRRLQRIAGAVEPLLPFITYVIYKRELRAKMLGENPPAPPDTLTVYRKLTAEELKNQIFEEHERARMLDDKTSKMTLSLGLGLAILGSVAAVLLKELGTSGIAVFMVWVLAVSVIFILIGGFIALTSLRTMPTYGYGTEFKVKAKTADPSVEVYVDALLRQEKANQIRQVRNEAAIQTLQIGFVLFVIVLFLYFLTVASIGHTDPPQNPAHGDHTGCRFPIWGKDSPNKLPQSSAMSAGRLSGNCPVEPQRRLQTETGDATPFPVVQHLNYELSPPEIVWRSRFHR